MAVDEQRGELVWRRAEEFIQRLEGLLSQRRPAEVDWSAIAFRWRHSGGGGLLEPIRNPHRLALSDLLGIDHQRSTLERNTLQFVRGLPCNNALLWGSRGTGKSSLVKALLNEYAGQGLRVIEVDGHDLFDLPAIVAPLTGREERFVLFTDDLSFAADDPSYRALKAMLDGSVSVAPANVVIYATSNRRHLMPEFMQENLEARNLGGEIHHGETVEEKISLSERFGIWLSFRPFNQDTYLAIVRHWLKRLDPQLAFDEAAQEEALRWALQRGSRSGRVARQFAADWVGQHRL
ncbi:MAG: ATP-binding protein [Gammaproteobacteria bacterium]|nr:ATP-binding protein [Gammaproteobacteria bacterium]